MATSRMILAARQFSTSTASAQIIRPPIQVFGTGGRYAHALYSAASKQKKIDVADTELKTVQNTLAKNVRFQQFLVNPVVKKKEKLGVLNTFLSDNKMSPLTINFFCMLAENNRLSSMKEIFSAWDKIMSSHRGEVVCTVTTAKALSSAQTKQLNDALQGFLKKGETLSIDVKIDESVVAGMVVEIGDKYVDMSTATKVKRMTNLIRQAV